MNKKTWCKRKPWCSQETLVLTGNPGAHRKPIDETQMSKVTLVRKET
jgi:hypothetical protein